MNTVTTFFHYKCVNESESKKIAYKYKCPGCRQKSTTSPVNNHEGLFKTVFCSVVLQLYTEITAKLSTESERQV